MEFTKDIQFNNMPTENQGIKLTYHGFLSDSSELWIVYGFGENWEHTTEQKMKKSSKGFYANINILGTDTFNFCFRNAFNIWDNNSNCNYISPILPYNYEKIEQLFNELITPYEETEVIEKFDIDSLIEEILQPILIKQEETVTEINPPEVHYQSADLGVQITEILSQIDCETPIENDFEFSSLEEILAGTVLSETPIDLFEDSNDNSIDETTSEIDNTLNYLLNKLENCENQPKQTALIKTNTNFMISPRQLSKFYHLKKRIKLALYKIFVKLPKLIFGSQED